MPTSYCTVAELKDWLQIADTRDDTLLDRIVSAVSRWIDGYCGRQFGLEPATARTYQPTSPYVLDIGDVGDQTGFLVKTDPAGDGVYEITWAATDWQLLPVNAPTDGPEAAPWTELKAVGAQLFPVVYGTLTRCDRVQVTAAWGWPAIPDPVTQACVMQASRVFKRRDSPQGVLGGGDFGVVRVTSRLDPDVEQMLDEYRAGTTIVNLA